MSFKQTFSYHLITIYGHCVVIGRARLGRSITKMFCLEVGVQSQLVDFGSIESTQKKALLFLLPSLDSWEGGRGMYYC